jgi:hypothetical protein
MARSAWALRVASAARCVVERGTHGVVRMESVAAAPASGGVVREGGMLGEKVAVAFTVTPGVKVGDTAVKSSDNFVAFFICLSFG